MHLFDHFQKSGVESFQLFRIPSCLSCVFLASEKKCHWKRFRHSSKLGREDKIIWMEDFSVVLNDQLFFKPKLLFLPLNIQCNMQAFISYHSCSVPANSLDKLIHSLRKFEAEIIGWRLTHLKILKSKLKNFKETDSRDCRGSEES